MARETERETAPDRAGEGPGGGRGAEARRAKQARPVVQLGSGTERVLKRSPARSVRVVAARGREHVVVKRFDAGATGALNRLGLTPGRGRDRLRARTEFEVLRALHDSGAPVPRPLELRGPSESAAGGWEVTMEWFPAAVPLLSMFEGRAAWPRRRAVMAVALGRLLAQLHGRGLDHPDLHAGNVLIQPDGSPIAIDFHKARLVGHLDRETLEQHLVQLVAGSREFVPRAFRARFLRTWLAELPSRLLDRELRAAAAGAPRARSELEHRLERRGRALRRATVHRREARWTREGTAVRPLDEGTGWVRIDADPERLAALGAGRASTPPALRTGGDLVVERRSTRELLELWHVAARLFEHRVRSAAPLALCTAPRRWLAFELPEGARPAEGPERERARAELTDELADRGLAAELRDEHLWVDGSGTPLVVGVRELRDL